MSDINVTSETAEQQATCSGDVVKLLVYKDSKYSRKFTLCKVSMCGVENNTVWTYMLLVEGDKYPIIISKELAKSILANPKRGAELAYNCWMNRYR